jgi:hypothetical protein
MFSPLARRAIALAVVSLTIVISGRAQAQDVRVTVITVMASDKTKFVDPKLNDLAKEVSNREPTLTGYRLGTTTSKEINIGQKEVVDLIEKTVTADVKLIAKNDSKKQVTIEVKPPLVKTVTYATNYEKFFPIITGYQANNGERLIIAIMVKPVEKAAKPATAP